MNAKKILIYVVLTQFAIIYLVLTIVHVEMVITKKNSTVLILMNVHQIKIFVKIFIMNV